MAVRYGLSFVLILILIVLLIASIPAWPYAIGWGYYPFGAIGLALLIAIILVLIRRI